MEKVVIVDDDLSLCHFLKRTLILKGYQVFTYPDGREALEGIKDDCDLVLLDNRMPDLTGLEVLKELRKNFPEDARHHHDRLWNNGTRRLRPCAWVHLTTFSNRSSWRRSST